jgi:drug/metabolite transporter (DMT)-like permease
MVGLLLVLDLAGGGAHVSIVGVAWGLVAAVCLTMYFLLSDNIDAELPPIAFAGVGLIVGAVVLWTAGLLGLIGLSRGATEVGLAGSTVPWWMPVLVIAVLAAAFAYVSGIVAVRMLGAKVASFVALTEVLFAVLFAWMLLGELPHPIQLGGGVLVVAGLVAVRTDESRPPAA